MKPLLALIFSLSVLTADVDFVPIWAKIAQEPNRSGDFGALLNLATIADLTPEEELRRLWLVYSIAQTADQHRQILKAAASIDDVRARMLVGVYRFNDYHDELAKEQSAANKAQLKLLHDGQETLNYKDLPENSYDTSFVFDRWEDKDGIAARWTAGDWTLDVSPRPFGTFHGRLTRPGHEPLNVPGVLADGTACFYAPDVTAVLNSSGSTITVGGDERPLTRTPSGQTPGAEKPVDAVTLFDGKNTDAFQPTKWKIVDGSALEITRGSGLTTKENFGDMRLYLEFRQAYNPDTVGARRGNSGVMLMGYYEIALSDNFADPPQIKANGAIYGVAAPLVNASAAPLEWQSMLIDFTAPRFDATGKKIANAKVTAWQNGRLIHDQVEIVTPWEKNKPEPQKPAPLQLQQHGSCLQFRNIWVVKN